jgi:hypothetical protein
VGTYTQLHYQSDDGVKVTSTSLNSIYHGEYPGTLVHEFAHQLGAVDLYDLYPFDDNDFYGPSKWGLMGVSNPYYPLAKHPIHPTAWTKKLLGFLKDDHFTTVYEGEDTIININPIESEELSGKMGAIIQIDDDHYIMVEARRNDVSTLTFDDKLPGSGILTTLIDGDAYWGHGPVQIIHKNPDKIIDSDSSFDDAQLLKGEYLRYNESDVEIEISVLNEFEDGSFEVQIKYISGPEKNEATFPWSFLFSTFLLVPIIVKRKNKDGARK